MCDTERVVLYAEFTAKPGVGDDVERLLSGFAETVRAEPGNIIFDLYRREEAPAQFFVFEIYRDRAAFQDHLAGETGREFNDALVELIVENGSKLSFLLPAGAR